jgi:hypothetical protein
MSKSFSLKKVNRFISLIIMIMIISLIQSCYYYKVTKSKEPPAQALLRLQDSGKYIIMHYDTIARRLSDITADEDSVRGKVSFLSDHDKYLTTKPDGPTRYKKKAINDESQVLNEVHIYTKVLAKSGFKNVSFPIKSIEKIEIYDPAVGATVASWVFSGLAIAVPVIVVVALLTKESCPFIYVSDNDSYKFIGEIYSGAIYPSLERDDYLPLPKPKPGQAEYNIKMTNEVREIQNTNLIDLMVFDHPADTKVLVDKYGNYQTTSDLKAPVEATNLEGRNVLDVIKDEDSLSYFGEKNDKGQVVTDGVVLKFLRPKNTDHAKLVAKAKSTFWLDYVFTRFHSLFGDQYDCWVKKQETIPDKQMKTWQIDQKIPLLVYMEKKGKWKFIDYYNTVGPMAAREDVLPIDLTDFKGDTIKIKLEFGFMFWEVDYAALDFSLNVPVTQRTALFESAIDNKETDVKKLLESSDMLYYLQPEIGDEVNMKFSIPARTQPEQTLFLHSRGHYKILLDAKGEEQVKYLLPFRKKGRFPEYSGELFRQQTVPDLKYSGN